MFAEDGKFSWTMCRIPTVANGAPGCMCFDEYRTGQVRCVNGCRELDDYLKYRAFVALPPCQNPRTGTILLPGELNNKKLVSTDAGKKFVRSIFQGVWCVVDDGKYFRGTITEANIYVSRDGSAKFHNLEITDEGNHAQRVARRRRNYTEVCTIAKTKFAQAAASLGYTDPNDIPSDIRLLFHRVMNDKALYNIGLYHIHISLVPIGVGMLAFFKIDDHLLTTIPKATRDTILDNLYAECPEIFGKDQNHVLNWVNEARMNTLLNDIYCHIFANYVADEGNICKKQDIRPHDLKLKRGTIEYKILVKRTEVALFLDFLRNRTAHRMQSWILVQNEYTPEDADLVCLLKFRDFLVKVQWLLWRFNMLDRVNFSAIFV